MRHINAAARDLTERTHPELDAVAAPDFVLHGEELVELGARAGEAGLQARERFSFAEAMWDGDDEGFRHAADMGSGSVNESGACVQPALMRPLPEANSPGP